MNVVEIEYIFFGYYNISLDYYRIYEPFNFSCIIIFWYCSESRPQIWNIEQEKYREKENVGGRPAKLNEKKGDRDFEQEIKNKGDIFLLEEQPENFVTAVTKWEMLAATNAR